MKSLKSLKQTIIERIQGDPVGGPHRNALKWVLKELEPMIEQEEKKDENLAAYAKLGYSPEELEELISEYAKLGYSPEELEELISDNTAKTVVLAELGIIRLGEKLGQKSGNGSI